MIKHLYETTIFVPYSLKDRLTIYKMIKKQLDSMAVDHKKYRGFCLLLANAQGKLAAMQAVGIQRQLDQWDFIDFPELKAYRPPFLVTSYGTPGGVFWYALNEAGNNRRRQIIDEIITQVRKELYG